MLNIACSLDILERHHGSQLGPLWAVGFECLTEDLEEIMGLFSEVIQDPALQPDKTAFYKAQVTFFSIPAAIDLLLLQLHMMLLCYCCS